MRAILLLLILLIGVCVPTARGFFWEDILNPPNTTTPHQPPHSRDHNHDHDLGHNHTQNQDHADTQDHSQDHDHQHHQDPNHKKDHHSGHNHGLRPGHHNHSRKLKDFKHDHSQMHDDHDSRQNHNQTKHHNDHDHGEMHPVDFDHRQHHDHDYRDMHSDEYFDQQMDYGHNYKHHGRGHRNMYHGYHNRPMHRDHSDQHHYHRQRYGHDYRQMHHDNYGKNLRGIPDYQQQHDNDYQSLYDHDYHGDPSHHETPRGNFFTTLPPQESTAPGRTCPMLYTPVGDRCIAFFTVAKVSWPTAKEFCQGIHGDLLTFTSITQYLDLLTYLQTSEVSVNLWVGGRKEIEGEAVNHSWLWLDGSPMPMGTPYWTLRPRSGRYALSTHLIQAPSTTFSLENMCAAMDATYRYYLNDASCAQVRSPTCVLKANVTLVAVKGSEYSYPAFTPVPTLPTPATTPPIVEGSSEEEGSSEVEGSSEETEISSEEIEGSSEETEGLSEEIEGSSEEIEGSGYSGDAEDISDWSGFSELFIDQEV